MRNDPLGAEEYGQLVVTFDIEWDEEHGAGYLLDADGNIIDKTAREQLRELGVVMHNWYDVHKID